MDYDDVDMIVSWEREHLSSSLSRTFDYKATNPMVCPIFSGYSSFLAIKTYTDLIIPAVRGTTSALNSALKHGSE
jgi:hypothetical protein